MSQDRFLEMRRLSQNNPEQQKFKEDQFQSVQSNVSEDTNNFQGSLALAKNALQQIKENTTKIQSLQLQYQKAIVNNQEKEFSGQLDQIIQENQALSKQFKDAMTKMASVVNNDKNDPDARMRSNIYSSLSQKANVILTDSQKKQQEFKQGINDKITRQIRYLDNSLTETQVKEISQDPEQVQKLLAQKLVGPANIQVQNAVADIKDKHQDIIRLEQSVQQIYQLFVDMSLLVHQQGQQLDDIELNINDAQNYVEKGNKQLEKAKKDHQCSRKMMCMIGGVASVILLIIIIVIAS